MYGGSHDDDYIYVIGIGPGFLSNPYLFAVYVDFKEASQAENLFSDWWQKFLDIASEEMSPEKIIAKDVNLEKIRQNVPSRELALRWREIYPKLPSAYMETLKQNIHKAICIDFPPWILDNIIEAFERIHASAGFETEERIFIMTSGFWGGTIWKIDIGPFFIICQTDGWPYDLTSPDMAGFDLRQFSR